VEIDDLIGTLAPGERLSLRHIADDNSLPVEEVEREARALVERDPDLEMIVTSLGTFVERKRPRESVETPNNDRVCGVEAEEPERPNYKAILGLCAICAGIGFLEGVSWEA
jgi:hypothetical protein